MEDSRSTGIVSKVLQAWEANRFDRDALQELLDLVVKQHNEIGVLRLTIKNLEREVSWLDESLKRGQRI